MFVLCEETLCVTNGLFASKINRFSTELEGGCFTFRGYPWELLYPSYFTCHLVDVSGWPAPQGVGVMGKGFV